MVTPLLEQPAVPVQLDTCRTVIPQLNNRLFGRYRLVRCDVMDVADTSAPHRHIGYLREKAQLGKGAHCRHIVLRVGIDLTIAIPIAGGRGTGPVARVHFKDDSTVITVPNICDGVLSNKRYILSIDET